MKNQVIVTANPKTGEVFTETGVSEKDGKVYGYIRLESKELDMSGPVAQVKVLSCLKSIAKDTFQIAGINAGDVFPGKIRIVESTTPNPNRTKQEPKRIGDLVLTHMGAPIYRETEYCADATMADVRLAHDQSKEEIRLAGVNAQAKREVILTGTANPLA